MEQRIGSGISSADLSRICRTRKQDSASNVPAYIAGLIGLGDGKKMKTLVDRADALSYDRLHLHRCRDLGQRAARRCGEERRSWSVAARPD